MPHIHTESGQHDMTVSGYIVREREDGEWLCLVHMHRKIDMLMQIGGHIELDQTPWQALASELRDEAGYELSEVSVLQWAVTPKVLSKGIVHPLPLLMNTHKASETHYHSDTCYAFIADGLPSHSAASGESVDLRWMTLKGLQSAVTQGDALQDVAEIYEYLLESRSHMLALPAVDFSLAKPEKVGLVYKR